MAAVIGVRRELGLRTIFNLLGPLTNPAFARRQVLGVFAHDRVETIARVLQNLGAEQALVVHSRDGLDEISISAPTFVCELRDGVLRSYELRPDDLGVVPGTLEDVAGGDIPTNAAIALRVLGGEPGPRQEIVAANAGAALYVAGVAPSLRSGVTRAREAIVSGGALRKLEDLIAATGEATR
jgi:anthranilate phosphoribosyltransferase